MMLRIFVLVAAMLVFTGALYGTVIDPGVWPAMLVSGLVLAGILFERARYGAVQRRPVEGAWQETSERFIDDASGRPVTVWFNPATGERRYVDGEGSKKP